MIIINILAAVIIAALAGLGVGGGGLLVIYLVLVLGYEQLAAQGINLLFFIFASAASLIYHAKKRSLDIRLILTVGLLGVCGCVLGSLLAKSLDSGALRKIFGAFLIASGVISLIWKKRN